MKKPIRINSNRAGICKEGQHDYLSCGINSLSSILETLEVEGLDIDELNTEIIRLNREIELGGIYNIDIMAQVLEHITSKYRDVEYEIKEFNTLEEFKSIIENNISNSYIMVCYYALQGFIRITKHPSMEHAHFGIIYDYNKEKERIHGSQSNSKADKLKCLEGVDIETFYNSCCIVNKLKLNWGKYNKCNINVSRKQLETCARCGENTCKLGLSSTEKCVYYPTIGNKAIIIRKKSD